MLDVLEHLERLSNDIFTKIETRIANQKNKLQSVQKRTQEASV